MTQPVPAAVAILLIKQETLLLGKRFEKGKFSGWQCPGGFIGHGESLQQAAIRLCLSKAGVQPGELQPVSFTNNIFNGQHIPQHTVTLYFVSHDYQVIDQTLFHDEGYSWNQFKIDNIPQPRFLPLDILLNQIDIKQL